MAARTFYKARRENRLVEMLYYFFRYGVLSLTVYNWLSDINYHGVNSFPDFMNLSDLAENRGDICYIDTGHYRPAFSHVIAGNISKTICNNQKG